MQDIRYTLASPDDLPAVRELLDRCTLPTEDLQPAHLAHFVVCRCGDRLVGTVGLEPVGDDAALLRSLAVAPDLRGRRIGHELWERARAHARRRGARRLFLLTTTAEKLFSRWGFRILPRAEVPDAVQNTSEYRFACPSTATVMVADLDP